MTGYDEADGWLREHAPRWRIARADVSLVPAYTIGGPTTQRVEVELVEQPPSDVYVRGVGATYLEAVSAAVGGLKL